MTKYLDEAGVRKLWAKAKEKASEAQSNAVATAGNYTVNGKKISSNPTLSKSDVGLGNVTNEAQIPLSQKGVASGVATLGSDGKLTSAQLPALKTINGTSVVGSGNITIDLAIYTIVTALPTTGINKNKIYLLLTNEGETQDRYTEYIYTGDTSATYDASKWEKLGKYKADVDLSAYLKTADANKTYFAGVSMTTSTRGDIEINLISEDETKTKSVRIPAASVAFAGLMTKDDKAKLDGITAGAEVNQNAFSRVTVGSTNIDADSKTDALTLVAGTNVTITPDATNDKITIAAKDTTYGVATTSANGLMSKEDKTRLDELKAQLLDNSKADTLPADILSDTSIVYEETKVTLEFEQNHCGSSDGYQPVTKERTISAATSTQAGVMSAADKKKLDGIAAGANAYSHPAGSAASKTAGFYKISTDAQSHVASVAAVTKSDITALGIPAQDTTYSVATTSANGLMSKEDKSKLAGIAAGAEVNQNAFSNVVVGSTTIAADSKTDSLTLVAGSNVTITPDATNDKITIAAKDTTYSVATTSANGLMSAADKKILDYYSYNRGSYLQVDYDGGMSYTKSEVYLGEAYHGPLDDIESTTIIMTAATSVQAGVMSAADKTKLDGIVALTDTEIDAILV
ncbi:MAG: hypothetical protein PUC90_02795 [Prevotella sp.]|nr:hypothetical protein [Prevotella sp.]